MIELLPALLGPNSSVIGFRSKATRWLMALKFSMAIDVIILARSHRSVSRGRGQIDRDRRDHAVRHSGQQEQEPHTLAVVGAQLLDVVGKYIRRPLVA